MNISATSGLITMKFYQKHHWDGGKAALGFGPDWIKTVVSMATDSSHRVIMEKTVLPLFLSCFSSVTMTCMGALRSWKFSQIGPPTTELAALKRLKNPHRLIMGKPVFHFFSAFLDRIHFILAGNDDIHKSLDEFEIRPDPIRDHRVCCS